MGTHGAAGTRVRALPPGSKTVSSMIANSARRRLLLNPSDWPVARRLFAVIVAALLMQLLPALLHSWGVSPDWLTILFGIGVLQVLTTAPAGLVDQVPKDLARLGRRLRRLDGRAAPPGGTG